jgi:hypothetical protein
MNGNIVSISGAVQETNPFAVVYKPAQEIFDAVTELQAALTWLSNQRRSQRRLFEPERAAELLQIIPPGARLADAGALLLRAIEEPAPQSWVHIAVGLELDAEPDAATDVRRFAIVDAICNDPETGAVSAPVLVRALRESRRMYDRLTPGNLIRLCLKHRQQFKTLHADLDDLAEVRYAAEDTLEAQGLLKLAYDDEGSMKLLGWSGHD